MTAEQRKKLRDLALQVLSANERLSRPWSVQTSNSFRRIGTDRGDGDVLCAVTQRSDGHPDLLAPSGVLDYIAAVHPRVLLELLEQIESIIPENPRASLERSIDPTSFFGTGLTISEFTRLGHAEKLAAAWTNQTREERKRRLSAVTRLSVELTHVIEKTNFSTRLAELAIEAVIEGDWRSVEDWAEHFGFEGERDEIRRDMVTIYANFRELLLQVLRTGTTSPA
jgi:hypothetical protein